MSDLFIPWFGLICYPCFSSTKFLEDIYFAIFLFTGYAHNVYKYVMVNMLRMNYWQCLLSEKQETFLKDKNSLIFETFRIKENSVLSFIQINIFTKCRKSIF